MLFRLNFPARTLHSSEWFGEMDNVTPFLEGVFVFFWNDFAGQGYGYCQDALWAEFQAAVALTPGQSVESMNSGQISSAISPSGWAALLGDVRNSRHNPRTESLRSAK